MAETGIQWGAWSQKARLGVNVRWDDIGAGTTQSHVYADFYYGTNAWGYNGNYSITYNGSLGGTSGTFNFYSATGATVTTFIAAYDMGVQNTSYSGGPSWTVGAVLTQTLYDGAKPSVSVGFTLPARPPSPPDPPAVHYDGLSSSTLHAFLSAPASDGGAGVDAYETYVLSNNAWPGSGGIVVASAATSGVYASGLTRATTYYFTGRARNAAGWSSWATMGAATTLATEPDAPTALGSSNLLPTTATVSWAAPANGGSAITSYDVQLATDAGFTVGVQTLNGGASPRNLTGLAPATPYYFRVRANSAVGNGAWSAGASFTTLPALYIGVGGVIKSAIPYVGVGGVPKMAIPYIGVGGIPKL